MTTTPDPMPRTGDIVRWSGNIAAQVIADVDTINAQHVDAGQVPALTSATHVHLWVTTPPGPGYGAGTWPEYDVPYDPSGAPNTWAWRS